MTAAAIPVDLRNPGQVFACLGLMETTEVLSGCCMVRFNYLANETECRFELNATEHCIEKAVRFLARCKAVAIAPQPKPGDKVLSTAKWQVETLSVDGGFFPGPTPDSPAPLPIRLSCEGVEIPIEHWLDNSRTGRDNLKLWAGQAVTRARHSRATLFLSCPYSTIKP